MDLNIIIPAVLGLVGGMVSGIIASLIAPWANWRVERVRLKAEYQRKRIAEWREAIEKADTFDQFTYTSTFADIRQYMKKEDVDSLFTAWITSGNGNTEKMKLTKLLEAVYEIEKKWNLI